MKNKPKGRKKEFFILLDKYRNPDKGDPKKGDWIPSQRELDDTQKTERMQLKLTKAEKLMIEKISNRRGKTMTEFMITAAVLYQKCIEQGATSGIDVIKAVRFVKVLKRYGGANALTSFVSEKDITFDGDEQWNEYCNF